MQEITGLDISRQLDDTLILDFIIGNTDRNYWNTGVIINPNGLYREAPIFDSGSSLGLQTFKEGQFSTLELNNTEAKPFRCTYVEQIQLVKNRKYRLDITNTLKLLDTLYREVSTSSNEYKIDNPITSGQYNYIRSRLQHSINYLVTNRSDLKQ